MMASEKTSVERRATNRWRNSGSGGRREEGGGGGGRRDEGGGRREGEEGKKCLKSVKHPIP